MDRWTMARTLQHAAQVSANGPTDEHTISKLSKVEGFTVFVTRPRIGSRIHLTKPRWQRDLSRRVARPLEYSAIAGPDDEVKSACTASVKKV